MEATRTARLRLFSTVAEERMMQPKQDTRRGNPVFQARLTILPPSANKMYVKTRNGVVQSKEMKVFLAQASVELLRQLPLSFLKPNQNRPHRLVLDLYLPELYNRGFPNGTPNRFKKRDASNLVKVVEDLTARSLGIDDSCFVSVIVNKHHGPEHQFEGLTILLEELEE